MLVTYEDIRNDESIKCYITEADKALSALGYTEHSFPHVVKAATMAEMILLTLNYPKRTAELAKIAGYMHDIGNIVNRIDHAQSGAVMAFRLLDRMGMDPAEIAMVISGNGVFLKRMIENNALGPILRQSVISVKCRKCYHTQYRIFVRHGILL